ncbi:MAG: hypothetical protein Kow0067_02780 [Coriobacteriia bacterium]
MRIGMLLMGGTYPPDVRVDKEARVLAEAGHEIFLLTSDKNGRPSAEPLPPLEVRRYPARGGWLESKLTALVNFLTWRMPLWERHIDAFVAENGIEALHVHDLPAVASAVAVGRRRGIPVVFDMHEYYPGAVRVWPRPWLAKLIQTPARYERYHTWATRAVDAVIPAVEETQEMALAAGVPPERVWLFRNVEDAGEIVRWEGPEEGAFVVTFAGGFGPHRGIDTLISAMPLLLELVPGARLLLIGSGSNDAELRALAGELGVSEHVEFTGWIGIDEMRERLAHSSVGTAPFTRSAHTDTMLPHKLFQYMGMGLPVVVTDCKPVARIVHETGAGEVARSGDAASVARALARLADPDRARAASEAGKRAVAERYNLEIEGMRLAELYESLARRAEPSASSE